jgi:shikimate dehydrogenase
MLVDKDTQICISVASRPGNFGTTVHNAAFQALGLNFIYKSFGIDNIAGAVTGVRALSLRGCGVSMPFKESVIPYLDALNEDTASIGAVNTVVNTDGVLTGYNTDAYGVQKALEGVKDMACKKVMVLGAGGVAKAILYALRSGGVADVTIVNRSPEKANTLALKMGYRSAPWGERSRIDAEVLINATPIGMRPDVEQSPVDEQTIDRCSVLMDAVISPTETLLVQTARRMGKTIVPGSKMSLFQAAMQFKLYTGVEPPLDIMETAMNGLLGASD